jgi:hypothetical protein
MKGRYLFMEPKRYMNPVHHGQHPHHHGPCHPCPGGRVGIIGQIELTVRYVDHHGHVRYFPIKQGEMYCIEALSSTKGICTFMEKVNIGIQKTQTRMLK